MKKKKWIVIGIVAAAVAILVACAAPYMMMGAPAEGLVKVRKGSSVEQITDTVVYRILSLIGVKNDGFKWGEM